MHRTHFAACVLFGALALGVLAADDQHPLDQLHKDAEALRGVFQSPQAIQMLDQVESIPVIDERTIYVSYGPNPGYNQIKWYTQTQFDALVEDSREGLQAFEVDASRYYSTFYGTPLVYARVLDLAHEYAPQFKVDGARILDLGYGQLGQLRLWAQMGADVVGVEVDPILSAMYDGCEAIGDIEHAGSVHLLECAWPNEDDCRHRVSSGYDLIVSRNLLKRGYVKPTSLNPSFPVPVAWGMEDQEALSHFFDALAPGGIVIIESLGPKPDPSKPWSNISNPWARGVWEQVGFEVLAHDQDESEHARTMGAALGWDAQMNLEEDLFGVYSVYRKPSK